MKAILLAGGQGRRLRSITGNLPKPMVPLVGVPVLDRLLDLLRRNGFTDVCMTLCYRPEVIQEHCGDGSSYGIAFATVEEIEERNILGATFLAMNRAIAQLSPQPALALIDGNRNTGIAVPSRCIVGGDGKCADIAAASVLAKVTRDRYMRRMAETYPQYGFEKHKGYGTAAHYAAIRAYGPSPIHRPSFLKKMH